MTLVAMLSVMLSVAGIASADGTLTAYEQAAGDDSYAATCDVFDEMFTGNLANDASVVLGVGQAMMLYYPALDAESVGDVLTYQVGTYCPEHYSAMMAAVSAAVNQQQDNRVAVA